MTMLGIEAQRVFWLRTLRISQGGKRGNREANLMVDEKIAAATEAMWSLALGGSPDSVVGRYRRKIRANARRLSR